MGRAAADLLSETGKKDNQLMECNAGTVRRRALAQVKGGDSHYKKAIAA